MSDDVEARLAALEARVAELEARLGTEGEDDDPWSRLGMLQGERRIVTVLFADVSGFTAYTEKADPESVQLVMRDTMSLLARCVTEEGGTVEKFIGDAVCAIFGAPVAYPDEPQRAARAALAMHRALAERAAAHPELPPVQVHAGINTGPVIAGGVGDGSQFGAMGDTVNTAARIMDLAENGETFVTSETYRRLRRRYRFEDRGLHEVKGKAKPIAAWALLGERADGDDGDGHGLDLVRVPLVGRDAELAALRARAERAAAGDGTTMVVVGEDGVGTSRLVEELAGELEPRGWRVLTGAARIHAETPLGLVASSLGPLVEGGPLAEALRGGGAAAPHDFELLLGELVVEAAGVQPLLVVLDDADDADPGSIEVVRYLSRATAGERVLWVLTGNRVPAVFDDAEVLAVGALSQEAVAELIDALVPGALDAPQRARLAHLAEGSAQFAKEIVVALIDEGVVVESAGGWTLAGDPDGIELPGSVAELVEARIDQLGTGTRVILQDAAVIGMRFTRDLLARAATVPDSVDAALAELVESDLVVAPEQPEGMWSLRSRLVRDVAYSSILRRRLPAAHRAVAEGLLALEPGRVADNADLIAHHFEDSDDPPLAVPHLAAAALRAERAFNATGSLERCRRALRIRDRFPGRVDDEIAVHLLQRAGVLKLVLGDRSGIDELRAAVDLRAAVGPPTALAVLLERVGWYVSLYGPRDLATEHLEGARELARSIEGGWGEVVLAGADLTDVLRAAAAGDLAGGRPAVEAATAVAARSGDLFLGTRARLVEGLLDLWSGRLDEAAASLRAAMDLAWTNVFGTLADLCGRWLVLALTDADRWEEAVEVAEPILARADDRGSPSVACAVRAALARAWRRKGGVAEARELAAEAVAIATEEDVPADTATAAHLAEAMTWLAGPDADLDRVGAALDRAEAALAGDGWLRWRWSARIAHGRGQLARARGDRAGVVAAAAAVRAALVDAPDAPEIRLAVALDAAAASGEYGPPG